jgi:hypothetical protein
MGDTTTRNLTSLTVAALDTVRNQCREARKNSNHTFSRAKHIPLDSRVRAGINFIFRTNNLIQELDRDVWDAWDDDTFFTALRPLVARRESLLAIPEPRVQFVEEVEAMHLDITGNFTEVALEEAFYKAARNHKLVAAVETRDTFTKAKRKEFQTTLHSGFVERGKGIPWKLQGIAKLMSQSNTGEMTMREWFDHLAKQVEYVDGNKFLVDLALKNGKEYTGTRTGERSDRWNKPSSANTKDPAKDKDKSKDQKDTTSEKKPASPTGKPTGRLNKKCTGCGRTNHLVGDCAFARVTKNTRISIPLPRIGIVATLVSSGFTLRLRRRVLKSSYPSIGNLIRTIPQKLYLMRTRTLRTYHPGINLLRNAVQVRIHVMSVL